MFMSKALLQGHLNSAHKRWPCTKSPCKDQTPPKSFSREHDLARHMRDKHPPPGEKPQKVKCPRCSKPLQNEKSLRQHEDRCAGRKKRRCTVCKEFVSNSTDIRNHAKKHERDALRDAAAIASEQEREEERARKARKARKRKGRQDEDNQDNE